MILCDVFCKLVLIVDVLVVGGLMGGVCFCCGIFFSEMLGFGLFVCIGVRVFLLFFLGIFRGVILGVLWMGLMMVVWLFVFC